MYGHGATCSGSGASRPTASAPALAASAERHQASQVRSAAIDVRRAWSSTAGTAATLGGSGSSGGMRGGWGCAMTTSNTCRRGEDQVFRWGGDEFDRRGAPDRKQAGGGAAYASAA